MRTTHYTLLFLFFFYFALYGLVNYPAISQAWWYRDDFPLTETPRPNKGQLDTLNHGRPINYLLLATYQWETGEQWAAVNISLRLFQVAFHALAATVASALLARKRQDWSSYAAVLIFLLYPFNGEAVLWRSAALNPLAAFFSLLGVGLIRYALPGGQSAPSAAHLRERKRLGTRVAQMSGFSLIALAMLTHQQAALAGLVVWVLSLGFQALQQQPLSAIWWRTSAWILSGYLAGIGLSRFCIYLFFGSAGRAALTTDWFSKADLALTLNRLYLWSDYYPNWLAALHLLLLVGGLGVAGRHWISQRRRNAGWMPVAALTSLLILPYAIVLLTVESWPAWRVTYLAPFVMIGAWLFLDQSLATHPRSRLLNGILLALLLVGYLPIAWTNSAEYVFVFEQDLAQMKAVETWAMQQPESPAAIVVATAPAYMRTWNPYGITYLQADSKVSAFLADWTIAPLVAFFTDLTPQQQNAETKQACVQFCLRPPNQQPFFLSLLPPDNTVCVCP
ncbi:MAG: hypothetical protein R3E79_38440 [Caldilineaceae bacterium]